MTSFEPVSCKVNCKINIGLQIVRKREDGYHDICTVFYPTDFFADVLTVSPSTDIFSFECQSAQDIGPEENNLCVKAFRLLQTDFGISNVRISLEKHIPSGAGLGGGSADAAFTLKMLNEVFQLNISAEQLKKYALSLGSDVPFFIDNVPMYATGRGEIMTPVSLDLSSYDIRIWKPDFSVSTKEAYAGVSPRMPETELPALVSKPVSTWKNSVHNDFEDSLFLKYPELSALKSEIYSKGADYASMSGSGTAIYGLFKKQ